MSKNLLQKLSGQYHAWDARLVAISKNIRILSSIQWPIAVQQKFLQEFNPKTKVLPEIHYKPLKLPREKSVLQEIIHGVSLDDPVGRFIQRTAASYLLASEMLEQAGTVAFGELSQELYGKPADQLLHQSCSHLDLANRILETTKDFTKACAVTEAETCILPETVRAAIEAAAESMFPDNSIEVVLDPSLLSKAAAGAERIRVRSATCFSHYDIQQLIQHECYVHSLTAINGRRQPHLQSLSLPAPRTTMTQEGLAVFSEFVTHSIDVNRLRRIALRVKAVDLGLSGADFWEVLNFFLGEGVPQREAFQSASRVFRGGCVDGYSVFTKDCVYLSGLNEVHIFLQKAIQDGKIHYPEYLFAGRLTLGDLVDFEELFEIGYLAPPAHLPQWVSARPSLVAYLLYASLIGAVDVQSVSLESFRSIS